ncbi:penicillin-binding transpeptidase domain-containing protein [Streptomyces sp.]|uniref:penicillin-binding transpeptidase domain-containing protein n=1 Tax=Streptomyces sp. TaxID=1931 RepID=UPI002D3E151E|nr:penicillin-binding transpeptidase domain-containing protein [Streptomyces sp.]HZF87839.1 penicillin-binding transpeptidase domain-containing protein [Streptomyces sp.]
MRSTIRNPLTVTTLLVLLAGCGGGPEETPGAPGGQPASTQRSVRGLGDIVVAGRPVTGSEPSGLKKIPWQRTYSDGALYAPVTGYRSLAFGRAGLESVYDSALSEGTDVVTTIEPVVQQAAFTALGEDRGAAVALDAATGDLLAVVSTPSYDPGTFSGRLPADAEAWEKLNQDSGEPLHNRALRDATAPGGTFDLVIAAAALEHGLYRSADEPTRAGGSGDCAGASIRESLADACGDVFAAMADALGTGRIRETARAFGFDDRELFVPLRTASSTYDTDGTVTATPLQMARVAAALADGGRLVTPRLVAQVEKPAARAVSEGTAAALLPAVRAAGTWVPAEDADGTPLSWSLAYARTGDGRTVAIAARVADADPAAAARVTHRMTAALN